MTATDLHEALDSLARLADHDPAPDRLAGIARKRRAQRNRTVTIGAAAAVLAVGLGSAALAQSSPDGRSGPPVATSTPDPTTAADTLDVLMEIRAAGPEKVRVFYQLSGTSLSVRDPGTGDPVERGLPLGTRVLLDGKEVSGTDGGYVECDPAGRVEEYGTEFGPVEVPLDAGEHTISVEVGYCGPDGRRLTASDSDTSYFLGTTSVADRARTDLDGDGTIERLTLVDEGTSTAFVVSGSVNGRVDLDAADPNWISGRSDLDGNGVKEMAVDVQEGDLSYTFLVTAVDGVPTLVVPAEGSPSLINGKQDGRFFGSGVFNKVLTSWVGEVDTAWDPGIEETTPLTVPLDGGTWSLDGTTLRFTPWATPHCGAPDGGAVEC